MIPEEIGEVRLLFRIAAICIGLFSLVTSAIMLFYIASWTFSFAVKVILGLILGSFFVYVGITGTNYYWKPETETDDDI